MKRVLILVALSLFLCSTAHAQGGGGESTKKGSSKKVVTNKKNSAAPLAIVARLIGKWDGYTIWYNSQEHRHQQGAEQHCEFVRDDKGLKFIGLDGEILAEDDVYLAYKGGKLYGSYLFGNHGGTHGQVWTKRFTLELRNDNTLVFDDSSWKHEYQKRQ